MPKKKAKSAIIGIIILIALVWFAFPTFMINIETNLPHQLHDQLTGQDAISDTTEFDVGGTDLGIIVKHNAQYYYIFGDTFSGSNMAGNWRSNTIALSDDTDPSNGIMLNNWIITPGTSSAKELISSLKVDNVEMTCIPTTAISYAGNLYIYYMSVKHWSTTGGMWECNNASIAVSTDDGQTFTKMSNISWAGDSNFILFGLVQDSQLTSDSEPLYFLSTPSGRFGACYLCRVNKSQILDQSAYEYYTGLSTAENPIWNQDHNQAVEILPSPVGEVSVMWNLYLQKWTAFYTDNVDFSIVVRTADNIWGPWSEPYTIVDSTEYPSLYGSFVHPDLVENNGSIVYFIMSTFSDYNTFVMSVNLTSILNLGPYTIVGIDFIEDNAFLKLAGVLVKNFQHY
ncbi:MAG: DUF4185 domain-containing protein [Candidatus Thorarchaeota archaeon]